MFDLMREDGSHSAEVNGKTWSLLYYVRTDRRPDKSIIGMWYIAVEVGVTSPAPTYMIFVPAEEQG